MNQANIEKKNSLKILGVLILLNLVIRIGFFNINFAEYTDGILQLGFRETPNTLWPPLYPVLATTLSFIVGSMETAGKLVSLISNIALLIPLFFLTMRLFGRTAAMFAGLIFTISPVVLRWSVRVMTDSLFAFLLFTGLWLFLLCYEAVYEKKSSLSRVGPAFIIVSVLAALTRYQGLLLFPLALMLLVMAVLHNRKSFPVLALSSLLWLAVPLWMLIAGFGHTKQFAERTATTALSTFFAYFNNFESFIAYFPYFLTYPVALLFLYGIFNQFRKTGDGKSSDHETTPLNLRKVFFVLFLYVLLAILVAQSMFSSFQSRYLLPVIMCVIVYAGYGLRLVEKKFGERKRWVYSIILVATVTYGMLFSFAVMTLQRQAFGDIKASAEYIRDNVKEGTVIYSNEMYKPEYPCPKMRWWSGRAVRLFMGEQLTPGTVICVHSAYGGPASYQSLVRHLDTRYETEELASFEATIIPLLPDIMEDPISHQNPLAWIFRYRPQLTRTSVIKILKTR
jgi:hypothetical protein